MSGYGDKVKKYYTEYGIREWQRLARSPYSQLEFNTTMHFMKKNLPKNGHILDAGGGPGRYTIELAKQGYQVTLLDYTPAFLEIAEQKIEEHGVQDNVNRIIEGSIEDLSLFQDNEFDAVLCLGGPLNHLVEKKRRLKASSELIRVAKVGAPLFVSVIGRLAVCMNAIHQFMDELENRPDIFRLYVNTGFYAGDNGFAPCHFYLPEELEEEFREKSELLEMVGLEGIFSTRRRRYDEVIGMGKVSDLLWETHLATCTHPSIVGISEHFMLITRKADVLTNL